MSDTLTIDILAHSCHMRLNLPIFFKTAPLVNIRKVFKLMTVEPWRNRETHWKLQSFFPKWLEELETDVEIDSIDLKVAENALRAAESQTACFGTMATKEMKEEVRAKRREVKLHTGRLKQSKAVLERYGKVIDAYNLIQDKGD